MTRTEAERRLLAKIEALRQVEERENCEESLYEFVQKAWPTIDPAPWQDNWALEGLCLHLEAVTDGRVHKLIVNFPPRCTKTKIVSICWPCWTWIQKKVKATSGPQVQFFTTSYGYDGSLKSAKEQRQLLESPWFQKHWGKSVIIDQDQNMVAEFATTKGGRRQSTSIRGRLLGLGGMVNICDDPHNTEDVESDSEREASINGWKEFSTTRMNNPDEGAIVLVMQRLHSNDVTGHILDSEDAAEWVHYCVPMAFDPTRAHSTYLGHVDGVAITWEDPRTEPGELMWPERFTASKLATFKRDLGPYMYSGRYQQQPQPVEGGIVPYDWWKTYDETTAPDFGVLLEEDGVLHFPRLSFVLLYVDTAYGEKEINSFNACVAWGICYDRYDRPRAIMLESWHWRGPLLGMRAEEAASDSDRKKNWGLTERVLDTARRRKADAIVIENKTRAVDLEHEIRRLLRPGECAVHLDTPTTDKVARLHATVPLFADGCVWAPDKQWATDTIVEVMEVPKGKFNDRADCVSGGLNWLRQRGLLYLANESDKMNAEQNLYQSPREAIYDV